MDTLKVSPELQKEIEKQAKGVTITEKNVREILLKIREKKPEAFQAKHPGDVLALQYLETQAP